MLIQFVYLLIWFITLCIYGAALRVNPRTKTTNEVLDAFDEEFATNFAKRPDLEPVASLKRLLKKSIRNGAKDPCNATIFANFDTFIPKVGFGCKVNTFIEHFLLALYGRLPIAMREFSGNLFYNETWKKYFLNPMSFAVCNNSWDKNIVPEIRHDLDKIRAKAKAFVGRLGNHHSNYTFDLMHFLYTNLYQYSKGTMVRVNRTLGRLAKVNYIGVHIRHGDKWKETAPIATEKYGNEIIDHSDLFKSLDTIISSGIQNLRKTLLDHNIWTIYVASDDPTAHVTLKHKLGSNYTFIHTQKAGRNYGDDADMISLLTDIEALRRANFFIGTASSNMGRLIYYLRGRAEHSVSLDGGGFLHGGFVSL